MITILISIAMCNECWGSRPPHLLCYGAQHLVTTKNVQTIWSAQEIVQILIPLIKMLLFIKGVNLPEQFPKDSELTEIQFWQIPKLAHYYNIIRYLLVKLVGNAKGVVEREPVTRCREGGGLAKVWDFFFFGLLCYPMSDASKPCLKLYLSPKSLLIYV